MELILEFNEWDIPIEIDWTIFISEGLELAIDTTQHADARSRTRDGQDVNISKEEIKRLILSASNSIKQSISKFSSFVIHGTRSGLNVVGSAVKAIDKIIFKVITVMRKENFKPKPWDKYIVVTE